MDIVINIDSNVLYAVVGVIALYIIARLIDWLVPIQTIE